MRYSDHLTLEELQQPLPAEISRARCVESANLYYTLAAGDGDRLTISHLLCVIYTAYFVDDMMEGNFPLELFRFAETALRECWTNGERSGKFEMPAASQIAIQCVLGLYLQHLTHAPIFAHVYAEECAANFLSSDSASPIPP